RTGEMDPPPDHGEHSYRGSGLLADRKTLVTGGDSGIGRAVALAFAREGADVLFTHLPEEGEEAARTAHLV
ncbi:SDR family NAD(P)-dependent oxidoreductase, partial [Streptomyces sp. SID11233]|nr:SDR family NAD(P)-dependent oxidoreductase [Streptomyces sp. SID11233]